MAKQSHEPGPGRSTSDAAFSELKKEIAQRNDVAQKEARKRRRAKEQEQVQQRRRQELL